MLNKSKENKAQEEIVGFVMIVIIVVVIGLVFLGISLRNSNSNSGFTEDSIVVYQFLESVMEQTTDCFISIGRDYLSLNELIRECYETNNNCIGLKDSCSTLNDTIEIILSNSWSVDESNNLKGYEFESVYSLQDSQEKEEIIKISEGDCKRNSLGNSYFAPAFPGKITTTLKLCY